MPRSISWQARRGEIHRKVKDSSRTPYHRTDIERLFRLRTDAANKLLQLMPRIEQGNATVVEREDLLTFLAGAIDAEDLPTYLAELRKSPPKPSRRKVRIFVPTDFIRDKLQPVSVHNIWLKRGKLEINYTTLDDFFSKLSILFGIIQDPDFERRYCEPAKPSAQQEHDALELKLIRSSNRYMVKVAAACQAAHQGQMEIASLLHSEAASLAAEVQHLSTELGVDSELLERATQMLQELFPSQNGHHPGHHPENLPKPQQNPTQTSR